MIVRLMVFFILFVATVLGSCKKKEITGEYKWIPLKVTASAYNSHPSQTEGHPNVTAWGDTLFPGIRSIAVSRDLISKGLRHRTLVKIEGFEGIFIVNDKMHRKWRNKIDIYMGDDIDKAHEWGRKKLVIHYAVHKDSVAPQMTSN